MRHLVLPALTVLLLAVAPGDARAGGCTPCASSAECVAMFGEPAFCISWDDSTAGCAGTPIQCCPGQGCSALSGRPSCEAEGRCHVVDEDAGVPRTDAGSRPDASSGVDVGSASMDAGASGVDAATGGGTARGGCTCGIGRSASGGWLVSIVAVVAAIRRRRRR